MRMQLDLVRRGILAGPEAIHRLRSWFAHLKHADTYQLRKRLWGEARTVLQEYI
jgi:hypothetical protein